MILQMSVKGNYSPQKGNGVFLGEKTPFGVSLQRKNSWGRFYTWDAATRRDEKFDSKWFAIRRKSANHRSKQFDGYNRRKHQNNNLCLMLLGYCLFLSTSYNRLYQISIKNFKPNDRFFERIRWETKDFGRKTLSRRAFFDTIRKN